VYKLRCFIVIKGELVCGIFFETYFGVLSVPELIISALSEKAGDDVLMVIYGDNVHSVPK